MHNSNNQVSSQCRPVVDAVGAACSTVKVLYGNIRRDLKLAMSLETLCKFCTEVGGGPIEDDDLRSRTPPAQFCCSQADIDMHACI